MGDIVEQGKVQASRIFKEAADHGHAHSMWIYACELLWGKGRYTQSVSEGRNYLRQSTAAGCAQACVTLASLHEKGALGLEKEADRAEECGAMARRDIKNVFKPNGQTYGDMPNN